MKRIVTFITISFILVYILMLLNRTFQITYKVSYEKILQIDEKNIEDKIGIVRNISQKSGGVFRVKEIDGHPGSLDRKKNYKFIHFGYCSFEECLVLSNNFNKNEFYLFYYYNYLIPGSNRSSTIENELNNVGM